VGYTLIKLSECKVAEIFGNSKRICNIANAKKMGATVMVALVVLEVRV
jgi:hypothetical protein